MSGVIITGTMLTFTMGSEAPVRSMLAESRIGAGTSFESKTTGKSMVTGRLSSFSARVKLNPVKLSSPNRIPFCRISSSVSGRVVTWVTRTRSITSTVAESGDARRN